MTKSGSKTNDEIENFLIQKRGSNTLNMTKQKRNAKVNVKLAAKVIQGCTEISFLMQWHQVAFILQFTSQFTVQINYLLQIGHNSQSTEHMIQIT